MRLIGAFIVAGLFMTGHAMGVRHDRTDAVHRELGARPVFDFVGAVEIGGKVMGTAELIGPRTLVTAAHVVHGQDAANMKVLLKDKAYKISGVITHEEYQKPIEQNSSDAIFKKGVDLAILHLEAQPVGIKPVRLFAGPEVVGKTATLIGYGTFGIGPEVVTKPERPGVRRGGTNAIDQVGGMVGKRQLPKQLLIMDFDSPNSPRLSQTGADQPSDLEAIPIAGDSGGAVLVNVGGVYQLAGVFNTSSIRINDDLKKEGLYGSYCMALDVRQYAAWLKMRLR